MEDWLDWQKLYIHGALVVWPPDPVRSMVNLLRQTYDPVSQAICEAHITLSQPFLSKPTERDWVTLTDVASGLTPFEIAFGPLNAFFPNSVIYYEIQPAERLLEMRQLLHATGLFNPRVPYAEKFIPHMTITESKSGVTADEEMLARLSQSAVSGSFHCSHLSYIVPGNSFNFRVARQLKLGR